MPPIRITPRRLRFFMNLWPPFVGAGIRVLHIAPDWTHARIRLRRNIFNQNYFGTHFGGSLYAMVNPFFPLLILNQLPPGHIVWDTAAKVSFVRAVREDVFADIRVDAATVASLTDAARDGEKVLRWFETDVVTASGEVVATVAKEIYIRRKRPAPPNLAFSHSSSRKLPAGENC